MSIASVLSQSSDVPTINVSRENGCVIMMMTVETNQMRILNFVPVSLTVCTSVFFCTSQLIVYNTEYDFLFKESKL